MVLVNGIGDEGYLICFTGFLRSSLNSSETESLDRPFALLLLMTLLPAFVFILLRNPNFRILLIFDGWYVLFISSGIVP